MSTCSVIKKPYGVKQTLPGGRQRVGGRGPNFEQLETLGLQGLAPCIGRDEDFISLTQRRTGGR